MKGILLYISFCFLFVPLALAQDKGDTYIPYQHDTAKILSTIKTAEALQNINSDSSIKLLQILLKESYTIGFTNGIASALVALGMDYNSAGEEKKTLACYLTAMPFAQKCSYNRQLLATLYTGLGTPYLKQGDYGLCGYYLYKAMQEVKDNGLQDSIITCHLYLNLSNLWCAMRQYNYSLRYLYQSLKIALCNNDTVSLISVYGNLGTLYYIKKEDNRGFAYMQQALLLADAKHIVHSQQILLVNTAVNLRHDNKPRTAILNLERSISLADDEHAYQHNLSAYYNLAFAYYETGNYTKAKKYALTTLQKSEQLGIDKQNSAEAMYVMSGINQKEKKYKQAYEWLDKYLTRTNSYIQKEMDSSINRLEVNYQVSERDKMIAQSQLLLSKKEIELKNKNIWIGGISACIVLLSILSLAFYRAGRQRQYIQSINIRNLKQEKELVYLKAMMEGEEKERARLARELHDGIGGMLTSAKLSIGSIRGKNPGAPYANELNDVMELLNDIASETRQTAHNLMPDVLLKNNLKDALLLYCSNITLNGQLDIDVQFYGVLNEISKSVELILYRITQELIQNIIRHARATHALVQIVQDNGRLNLIIEDNGEGFDVNAYPKGLGLQNLQFRVQALQGYISINSENGKGTSVYIEFDLSKLK